MYHSPRGFTLFIALIMTSVILAIGLSLLDVSYKQVLLASTAKTSVSAFYNADAALECALYWDAKDTFDYANQAVSNGGPITCEGQSITFTTVSQPPYYLTTFNIPFPGDSTPGDYIATVSIYKQISGSTILYANGFDDSKASDTRRTERGLKASY